MTTITDVAKHAKVAVSTVSYAISGTRPVSQATRERIFASMKELGYRPNALARGLASKKSRIIALILPTTYRGLGLTEIAFVVSASQAAREHGYNLVLWSTEIRDANELKQLMGQGLVDGVIVMEIHRSDERIDLLRSIDFPFSMIGRTENNVGINCVDINFGETIKLVLDHLCELNHTHIGLINQAQEEYESGYGPVVRAHDWFESEVAARQLHGSTTFCETSAADGHAAVNNLLDKDPDLTALVVMNDWALPGVLRAIAERGLRIPDDISIVSIVTAEPLAEMTSPTITTAEAPARELGRISTEMLIGQLEGNQKEVSEVLIPCTLTIRQSSAECRTTRADLKI